MAGDRPAGAEEHTRDSLVARRDGTPEGGARWGQYMACSCALAVEHQLAAGPLEVEAELGEEYW